MTVTLHIDRLVLDDLAIGTHQGPLVQAAIEAELARLLTDGAAAGHLFRDANAAFVRTAPILDPAGDVERLGTQIGHAIAQGIGQ